MENIWLGSRSINNENRQYAPTNASKQLLSARKHTVNKLAFSELKNVMHNNDATPLKGGVFPGMLSASKSLRKQTLKHNFSEAQAKLETAEKKYIFNEDNVLDYMDMPMSCCTGINRKSDREMWNDMNILEEPVFLGIEDDCDDQDTYPACVLDDTLPDISFPDIDFNNIAESDDDEFVGFKPPAFLTLDESF